MFLARRCLKYLRYELLLKNGSGIFIGLMTVGFIARNAYFHFVDSQIQTSISFDWGPMDFLGVPWRPRAVLWEPRYAVGGL